MTSALSRCATSGVSCAVPQPRKHSQGYVMRTKPILFGVMSLVAASAAHAIGVDELIAKNAAARGGLDKIQAIKSLKLQGSLRYGGSVDLDYAQYKKAPESVRSEATLQGLT